MATKRTPTPPPSHRGPVLFQGEDANRVRQWFNAVQDLNPAFLERADYDLAARLYVALGWPVPRSVRDQLK